MRRTVGMKLMLHRPHSPFYSGQYLADNEDVVVVTVNYRLGIFGFSGAPGIEQNAGLRDQRSAVEWVKDNILGFGGDPDRIIIFGQSAGGAAVDYWAYAYQHDPIVAGMISHSGTALSYIPNTSEYSRSIYHNVSTTLGCGNGTESQDTLSCLRQRTSHRYSQQPATSLLYPPKHLPKRLSIPQSTTSQSSPITPPWEPPDLSPKSPTWQEQAITKRASTEYPPSVQMFLCPRINGSCSTSELSLVRQSTPTISALLMVCLLGGIAIWGTLTIFVCTILGASIPTVDPTTART